MRIYDICVYLLSLGGGRREAYFSLQTNKKKSLFQCIWQLCLLFVHLPNFFFCKQTFLWFVNETLYQMTHTCGFWFYLVVSHFKYKTFMSFTIACTILLACTATASAAAAATFFDAVDKGWKATLELFSNFVFFYVERNTHWMSGKYSKRRKPRVKYVTSDISYSKKFADGIRKWKESLAKAFSIQSDHKHTHTHTFLAFIHSHTYFLDLCWFSCSQMVSAEIMAFLWLIFTF